MLRICRLPNCEPRLRLYVHAYARASRLQVTARIMLALAVSEKVQRRQGETLAGPITTIERIRATARVTRDFHRIQALLGDALQRKYYSLIPYIVDDWLEACLPFLHALRLAQQNEAAEACAAALWQAVPPSIAVAKVLFDEATGHSLVQMIGLKVVGLAPNDPGKAEKFIAQFEQELGGEKPLNRRDEIVRMMRELLAGAAKEAKQKPSMADARAYFEQQAAALGIDLSDPNDRIAEVVRIGLEDLDPTRVSRNCQHIHLRPEARGVPAEMLGLVTAGSKSITCLKHGHGMQGLKLDGVYAMFARRMPWDDGSAIRCENCPDRMPHPVDWNWSEEWEIAQAARFAKLNGEKDAT